MARILITGGAGFLGSHLCDHFLAEGHEVICMDNLITGNIENISHIRSENFFFIKHDVTNYIYIDGPLDFILHFASPASPIDYQELPIQTLKVGSLGTHKALGLAKEKNATFLLASTSEVYGDPLVHPQSENYWGNVNPIGPRGVYDEAKRFSEALTMAYHRYHGVETRIARIFNTYGPRMRLGDGRVVPTMMAQAMRGEALTVFGDGKQTRSFCFVEDHTRLVRKLSENVSNEIVNVGNDKETKIIDLAELIHKIENKKFEPKYLPGREYDHKRRQPDISKLKKLINDYPKVSLEEGLRKTIDQFKQKIK